MYITKHIISLSFNILQLYVKAYTKITVLHYIKNILFYLPTHSKKQYIAMLSLNYACVIKLLLLSLITQIIIQALDRIQLNKTQISY